MSGLFTYLYSGKKVSFDDTITFENDLIINDSPRYRYLGNYIQNPITRKVFHAFLDGAGHTWDPTRFCAARPVKDYGKTIETQFTIWDPTGTGIALHEFGLDYDLSGRCHCFGYTRDKDDILTAINQLWYFYTDNDFQTISTPITLSQPVDGLFGAWLPGKCLDNQGVLMKNYYSQDAAIATQSANYLLRSTDGGVNWSTITIRAKSARYINEADIVALNQTDLLVLFRNEDDGGWNQWRSFDNGLTWAEDGNITFGENVSGGRKPPSMRMFRINGIPVVAMYSFNTIRNKHFVVYGLASDLAANGLSGWNNSTKVILDTTCNWGYNNEVHFDDSLRAIMTAMNDISLAASDSHYYTLPTTHYETLKTQLGI